MIYEVISYHFYGMAQRRDFATLEDIVNCYWREFVYGMKDDFRVLHKFDRQRVDINLLWNIYQRKRRANYESYYNRHGKYEFRNGPVPGIRKGHNYGHRTRSPKTLAELREVAFFDHDEDLDGLKIKLRKCRGDLPTRWDDPIRGDLYERSWKRHRKTQYKVLE